MRDELEHRKTLRAINRKDKISLEWGLENVKKLKFFWLNFNSIFFQIALKII